MERQMSAALLGDSLLRKVFNRVVDERTITFKEIAARENSKDVSEALRQLVGADLIRERVSFVSEDFSVYYSSAKGLAAQRELRHFERKLSGI